MRKLTLILCCSVIFFSIGDRKVMSFPPFYYGDVGPPGPNDVHIGETAIIMPLGKILLIHKGANYGAIKFTDFWTGKTGEDYYARYESYYQVDKTGDLTKKNVKYREEELSFPKPLGVGRLAFSFGNTEVKCGPIRLFWSDKGAVHFYRLSQGQGDHGIELAPTKWTDISQVNVFDSRLKWYRYDDKRQRVNIPIDKLWED